MICEFCQCPQMGHVIGYVGGHMHCSCGRNVWECCDGEKGDGLFEEATQTTARTGGGKLLGTMGVDPE